MILEVLTVTSEERLKIEIYICIYVCMCLGVRAHVCVKLTLAIYYIAIIYLIE